jgi:hypothetical protein
MQKTDQLKIRMDPAVKQILLQQANENRRTMANQIEWLILEEEKRCRANRPERKYYEILL